MEAIVELFDSIPSILGVTLGGILVLYWFTDFFGFLRELLLRDPYKVERLERKILDLEAQLETQRTTKLSDSTDQGPRSALSDSSTAISV